jgi:hypothetical protein
MNYVPDLLRQQHRQAHQSGNVPRREPHCSICYPRPPEQAITPEFRRFWTWIGQNHNATRFNGFTVASFTVLHQELSADNPTLTVAELANLTTSLITSIEYDHSQILLVTPVAELCFYIHRLFERTQLFSRSIRQQDLLSAFAAYHTPLQPQPDSQPVNQPNNPPNQQPVPPPQPVPNNNATMDANQLNATLTQVLGQNGLNVQALTQNIQAAVQAMQNVQQPQQQAQQQQPRELSLVKVTDFYGKESEDPHE